MRVQEPYPIDADAIRADLPILERKAGGNISTPGEHDDDTTPLVHLGNTVTSHTPEQVIDIIVDYCHGYSSDAHRGIHYLSQEAPVVHEDAHDRVTEFIGVSGGRKEVVFTKNTTGSMNLVAYARGLDKLGPSGSVVVTEMGHHISLVMWQQIAKRTGAEVRYIRVDDDGRLDMEYAKELVDDSMKAVLAVHVSNTLGAVNPAFELADMAHEVGSYILVDGAQSVLTHSVDVKDIDADFFALSDHGMCDPAGIGIPYDKRNIFDEMGLYFYGGEVIRSVTYENSTWEDSPWKFKTGMPSITQGIGFVVAVDYLDGIGMENVQAHEELPAEYVYDHLTKFDDIEIYGPPGDNHGSLISFNLDSVHVHDPSSTLNEQGITIRTGDHCTQPLHGKFGTIASTWASFYTYNAREEVGKLVDAIDAVRGLFI